MNFGNSTFEAFMTFIDILTDRLEIIIRRPEPFLFHQTVHSITYVMETWLFVVDVMLLHEGGCCTVVSDVMISCRVVLFVISGLLAYYL